MCKYRIQTSVIARLQNQPPANRFVSGRIVLSIVRFLDWPRSFPLALSRPPIAMQPENLGHLFEDQAKFYAQFRPSYPPELYEAVYGLAKLPRRGTALDVATGSGQVAKVLANDFETVIGTDSSAGQLREAVRHPKITYQHVPAEDLQGVSDASVDLATVAEAFHW